MPSATDVPAQPVATKDAPKEKKVSLKKSAKDEEILKPFLNYVETGSDEE